MKLAKIILVLIVIGAVGALFFGFGPQSESINNPNRNTAVTGTSNRGDDPTYAEEVKQLTAMQRQTVTETEQRAAQLEDELKRLKQQIDDTKRAQRLNGGDAERLKQLENQVTTLNKTLAQTLNPLKNTIDKLSSQQSRNQSSGTPSGRAGYTRITPFTQAGVQAASTLPSLGALTSTASLGAANAGQGQANVKPEPIPVFTLHDGAILANARSVTPLIGRVPNAGNTQDPFRFRIVTGANNIMANGHRVPGVKDAIWSGFAIGVREESCVRGYLDSVTFVFEDGTISTVSQNKDATSTSLTQSLGYLTNASGTPCLPGLLISNASEYLKDRTIAAFAEGLAAAYASAQTTVDRSTSGNLTAFVEGDTIEFGVGRGLSRSASEVADYLRERQKNAFDVVYFPSNQNVQILLEQQINIDYDPAGRKVRYDISFNGDTDDAIPLD